MQTLTSFLNSTVPASRACLLEGLARCVRVPVDDGPARGLARQVVRLDPVEEDAPEGEEPDDDEDEHGQDERELGHRHAVVASQVDSSHRRSPS